MQVFRAAILVRVALNDIRPELATLAESEREEIVAAGEACQVHDFDCMWALDIRQPILLDGPGQVWRESLRAFG